MEVIPIESYLDGPLNYVSEVSLNCSDSCMVTRVSDSQLPAWLEYSSLLHHESNGNVSILCEVLSRVNVISQYPKLNMYTGTKIKYQVSTHSAVQKKCQLTPEVEDKTQGIGL